MLKTILALSLLTPTLASADCSYALKGLGSGYAEVDASGRAYSCALSFTQDDGRTDSQGRELITSYYSSCNGEEGSAASLAVVFVRRSLMPDTPLSAIFTSDTGARADCRLKK